MKLWILKPVENLRKNDDPWEPWYNKSFGFVVRAETEESARKFASEQSGDENSASWLDAKYSSCAELTTEGETGVVIQDFHAS